MELRFDITSTAVRHSRENFERCLEAAQRCGITLGVQLHNSESMDSVNEIISWQIPLSLHAPVSSAKTAFNFAAENAAKSFETLEKCALFMRQNKITDAVFHAFLMSDENPENFGPEISYDKSFGRLFRAENSIDGVCRFNCDFTHTDEFLRRRETLKRNLAEVRRLYPDLKFNIENDFPTYGSGNMLAKDAVYLENPLCLDIGHLWAACFMLKADYMAETERFFESGRIEMMHIHASKYTAAVPYGQWGDGHLPFATPNQMRLPEVAAIAKQAKLKYFVIEIAECSSDDVKYLADLLC